LSSLPAIAQIGPTSRTASCPPRNWQATGLPAAADLAGGGDHEVSLELNAAILSL